MPKKIFNVVELYAGTARSVEPFKRWPRARIGLLVDNDEYAAETYKFNYPNAPYHTTDLSKISAAELEALAGGSVDILLGCPPCQGFSDNGQKKRWDSRNRHLKNFARLAIELKPLAIAIENVPLAAGSNAFAQFTRLLASSGYNWTAGILNSALYGSAQCRQRLIYIGVHESVGCKPELPKPTHGGRRQYFNYNMRRLKRLTESKNALLGVTPATFQVRARLPFQEGVPGNICIPRIEDVLRDLPKIGTPEAVKLNHVSWAHSKAQLRRMARIREGGQPRVSRDYYSQSYGRLHRKGLAKTITTAFPNAGSGRYWHPTENRSLTLREAARLQGFPDRFAFVVPTSRAAFLVGNALDASLAKIVYRVVKNCLS